jgi:hypothetical protein
MSTPISETMTSTAGLLTPEMVASGAIATRKVLHCRRPRVQRSYLATVEVVLRGLAGDQGLSDRAADRPIPIRARGGSERGLPALSGPKVRCAPVSRYFYSYFVRFLVAVLVAVRCGIVCLCVRQYAAGRSSHHIHYVGLIRQNAAACDALQKRKKLTQNPPRATSWGFDPPSRHHRNQTDKCSKISTLASSLGLRHLRRRSLPATVPRTLRYNFGTVTPQGTVPERHGDPCKDSIGNLEGSHSKSRMADHS